MPSKVLSTRVPPDTYARLQVLAEESGRSLAGKAADILGAAVAGTPAPFTEADGPLVAAVRVTLADVTAPDAVLYREAALSLALTADRRERGHVSAVRQLPEVIRRARGAQRDADRPAPSLDDVLGMFDRL
ncbi:hypothetical protein ABZX90_08435 [Streptomyces sp. NPDC002935]|uniref:hypothetical protein n=1 Tax=Streptomyces sp. NPDC002935 TaxID=3154545 RepID=UPI0033BBD411